jgi:uncharacterized protein
VLKFFIMKKLILLICFLLLQTHYCVAQIEYIKVNSKILKDTREIKLQLPRNYDVGSQKSYPIIFVFDGDYLFEPTAGIVDFLSYWEEIPEAIVVGINQKGQRMSDGKYDKKDFLPVGTGAQFYDFILFEVLDYLKEQYNIGEFAIAVGHDYMGNFMNLFMFSEQTVFQGYVNLSPDIPKGLVPFIKEYLQNTESKIWYSLSTGSNDLDFLKTKTEQLHKNFKDIDNDLVFISFQSLDNTNHYTLVNPALSFSLLEIFSPYTPIDKTEYDDKLSKAENPVDYLIDKYEMMNALYDIEKSIRVSDIMQVSKRIEEQETWEYYQDLSRLAKQHYPKTLLFDYFSGRYFQEIGKPKKAIKAYQSGYAYKEAGGLTKEMLLDKAAELKDIFGY